VGKIEKILLCMKKRFTGEYSKTYLTVPIGHRTEGLLNLVKQGIKNQGIVPKQAPVIHRDRIYELIKKVTEVIRISETPSKKFTQLRLLTILVLAAELGVRLDDIVNLKYQNVIICDKNKFMIIKFVKSKNSKLCEYRRDKLSTNGDSMAGFVLLMYIKKFFKGVLSRAIFTTSDIKLNMVNRDTVARNLKDYMLTGENFTFHSFRVSKAHELYDNNTDIKALASYMAQSSGHKKIC
jgi:integrase